MTRPSLALRALAGIALAALVSACDGVNAPRIIGDILAVSGDNQEAPVGTQLPQPLVVKVVDDAAKGVAGVRIAWEVVSGNGALSAAETLTGSDGQTSIQATPTVGGQSTVTATINEVLEGLYQVTFVIEGK